MNYQAQDPNLQALALMLIDFLDPNHRAFNHQSMYIHKFSYRLQRNVELRSLGEHDIKF